MATNSILIRGARVVDPLQNLDGPSDILIEDGKIKLLEPSINVSTAQVIDARSLVVAPGFIDLHTHLREPGYEDKETIFSGTQAAMAGGFTTICCMPNTNPSIDTDVTVKFILEQARSAGKVRVLPIGAITKDRAGFELTDMEELAKSGVVAFSDDGSPVEDSHLMHMAFTYAKDLGIPIIDHCEDRRLSHSSGINDGWVSQRLGLHGYPAAAEESLISRDLALAKLTGSHFHAAHISTLGGAELIRLAKEQGINVTSEVTPHHLTLTEDWILGNQVSTGSGSYLTLNAYDTRSKVSPPLRTDKDIQGLLGALNAGVIDAIATDHAPHTFSDKMVPFGDATVGISNLETTFGSLMTLVHSNALSLTTLITKLTVGPAKVLGPTFTEYATLAPGTTADIVIFDPNHDWIVNTNEFKSKGKNSPLEGTSLKGRVMMTIAAGELIYVAPTDQIPQDGRS